MLDQVYSQILSEFCVFSTRDSTVKHQTSKQK